MSYANLLATWAIMWFTTEYQIYIVFSYYSDWIIILFFIYLDSFSVERTGGINLQGHFSGRSQFEKLGSRTFQSHCEALNDVFLRFLCPKLVCTLLIVFYTLRPFQRCKPFANQSSYAKFTPPASWPIVLTTMVQVDATSTPITHTYGASHVCNFKTILEGPKPYHNWGLRNSKT